ncbi:MAG: hypothetical protein JNN08_02855 [Bryobacterales bacterium]|nr:hypothetical protein [Bryobacterales bacterium]
MWLYDDPYEPYVPRSIFRKKAPEPAPAPTPPPAPASKSAEPQAVSEVSSGVEMVTVAEVNAVLDKWANAILGALRDFPDALRAVQDALRAFQKPLLAT